MLDNGQPTGPHRAMFLAMRDGKPWPQGTRGKGPMGLPITNVGVISYIQSQVLFREMKLDGGLGLLNRFALPPLGYNTRRLRE